MLRSKDIYLKACSRSPLLHQLTTNERHRLQSHLCVMYKDLEAVCDRHGLTMMLAFGSTLGAVRHQGFIPWDDDMDVFMPRNDYELLINEYANELPPNYIIYAPNSKNGAIARFAKLVDKNTKFVEPENENSAYYSGVFIDIFPLDYITNIRLVNRYKKLISMGLIYTAESVRHYQIHSKLYKSLLCNSPSGKFNYWFRQIYGFLFSFLNYQKWFNVIDCFCKASKVTPFLDFVQSDYRWVPLEESLFIPPKICKFENIEVYVPNRTIDYLSMEFGDWQWIPPQDQRPEHFVVEFKI